MLIWKGLVVASLLMTLGGAGIMSVAPSFEPITDTIDDIRDLGGRGGCHGRRDNYQDNGGYCHDSDEGESYRPDLDEKGSYCPYHDEDDEEHREDCPYHDDEDESSSTQ